MSGPKFERCDVIHTLAPHSDGGESRHWAVVVGDPLDCNGEYVCVLVVTREHVAKTDFRLLDSHDEFPATGLQRSSTIRCHRIFVVAENRVRTKLGVAGPSIMAEIQRRLKIALQL